MTSQFESLKAAILSTVGSTETREIAKGVIKFRILIEFLTPLVDSRIICENVNSFDDLIAQDAHIKTIFELNNIENYSGWALVRTDNKFFISMLHPQKIKSDWEQFRQMTNESKKIIWEAINEMERPFRTLVRFTDEDFDKVIANANIKGDKPNDDIPF